MNKIKIYDTTLRDGSQSSGISLTVDDKIKIVKILDDFGIDYIEGGWPGSNFTDMLFFKKIREIKLKNSQITAFGSTRYKDNKPENDPNLRAILRSKVKVACIFGKSWDFQVRCALKVSLEDNLKMIYESIEFLKKKGLSVIYDAEHFFDGFKSNKEYTLKTVKKAIEAGAFNITFCDTNGGCLPHEIQEILKVSIIELRKIKSDIEFGIHTHNDSETAVANSIIAVREGVELVQGTINGYGERCGNANLCSVIPNLQFKLGMKCISENNMKKLTQISRSIAEIVNITPNQLQPFVGYSAFAHKGGIHVSAVSKHTNTYEHISPSLVGNERRILISELSGKSNILSKIKELKLNFAKDEKSIQKIIKIIKNLEHLGYQFEEADASFALTVRKALNKHIPFFELKGFKVIVEKNILTKEMKSEAIIKISVDGKEEHTASDGDGPVNALDNALRKALEKFYPELKEISLHDFKVRVINATKGTAAKVRVLIETGDKNDTWGTIGVSENIIEASWQALVDAIEYKLLKKTKIKKGGVFK